MSKVSSDAVDTAPPSYATDINGPTMTSVDCSAPAHTQGESNYSPAGFVPLPQQTYPQQQAYQQPSYDNRTTAAPAFQQAGSYQNQQSNGPQQSQSCYHPNDAVERDFGCCAIALAVIFFPVGILCCWGMSTKKCRKCGAELNPTSLGV